MSDARLFEFLAPLAVREGATVIRPLPGAEGQVAHRMASVIDALRHVPAEIRTPDPRHSQYPFAERGARGRWMFIWIPED